MVASKTKAAFWIGIATLSLLSKIQAVVIQDGLIAHWTADDTGEDATTNNNDGTLIGNTTYTTGVIGSAFSFDGSGDYVQVPDSSLWTFTGDFTIGLWANFASNPGGSVGQAGSIFIGHDEGGGTQNKWWFGLGGGQLNFHINGPGTGLAFLALTDFNPNLEQWYHLSVTRSGNNFTTYIDGTAGTVQSGTLAIPNANTFITIGQAEGFFHHGAIDDITLYDRALSLSEINTLATIPEPTSALLLLLAAPLLLWRGSRS